MSITNYQTLASNISKDLRVVFPGRKSRLTIQSKSLCRSSPALLCRSSPTLLFYVQLPSNQIFSFDDVLRSNANKRKFVLHEPFEFYSQTEKKSHVCCLRNLASKYQTSNNIYFYFGLSHTVCLLLKRDFLIICWQQAVLNKIYLS